MCTAQLVAHRGALQRNMPSSADYTTCISIMMKSVGVYEYSKYKLHLLLTSLWIQWQPQVRVTLIITG
jgi:hypothetical protein